MKLTYLIIGFFWLMSTSAYGQKNFFSMFDIPYFKRYAHPNFSHTSFHGGLGIGVYSGDLSLPTSGSQQGGFMNPQLNIGVGHQLTHYVAVRAEAAWFRLKAKPIEGQWYDTGFKGSNLEAYVGIEHRLFPKYHFESIYNGFDPYVFVGIGMMRYSTKPTGTITQFSSNAKGSTRIIPLGLGFNYHIRGNLWVSLEGGARFVASDLIDNASAEDDPTPKNDRYFIYRLKVNYQPKKDFFYPHFLKRKRLRRR